MESQFHQFKRPETSRSDTDDFGEERSLFNPNRLRSKRTVDWKRRAWQQNRFSARAVRRGLLHKSGFDV
jgi:hypothetical protein